MFGKTKKKKISKEELLDSIIINFTYKDTIKDNDIPIFRFKTLDKTKIEFTLSGKYAYAKNTLDSGGISFIKVESVNTSGKEELIYHLNITDFLKWCDEFHAAVMPSKTDGGKNVILYRFHVTYNTIVMTFSVYETELYSSVQKHLINTALSAIYNKSV